MLFRSKAVGRLRYEMGETPQKLGRRSQRRWRLQQIELRYSQTELSKDRRLGRGWPHARLPVRHQTEEGWAGEATDGVDLRVRPPELSLTAAAAEERNLVRSPHVHSGERKGKRNCSIQEREWPVRPARWQLSVICMSNRGKSN